MLASSIGGVQALEKARFARCQCPSGKCMGRAEVANELDTLSHEFVVIVENCPFFRPEEGDEVHSLESGFKIWKLVRPERTKERSVEVTLVARPQTVLAFVTDDPLALTKQIPLLWSVKREQPSSAKQPTAQLQFNFWPAKV